MEGSFGHGHGMRDSRLVALVADDECGNAVIQGSLAGVESFVRLDLPGECVWMNAAVHQEPRLLPLGRHNGLGVDGHVEAEETAVGKTISGVRPQRGVLWEGDPARRGEGDSCNGLGVEAFDLLLVRTGEPLWCPGINEKHHGHIAASILLIVKRFPWGGLIMTGQWMLGHVVNAAEHWFGRGAQLSLWKGRSG